MSASNTTKSAIDGAGGQFPLAMAVESVSTSTAQETYLKEPVGETIITPAQDGTDGSGITAPTGGSGIRGWLSGIYKLLSTPLAVTGTFWPVTQPVSISSLPTVGGVLGSVNMNGAQFAVVPNVTASSYTAGFVIGGVMTFPSMLPATFIGKLQSITLRFKATAITTVGFNVAIFTSLPTGTFADHGAPAIAATDTNFLIGVYNFAVGSGQTNLGTHTIFNKDAINKKLIGSSTSLFAVVTTLTAAVTPASTLDMSLVLAVDW